jgi:predicted metal-binding membrane protein
MGHAVGVTAGGGGLLGAAGAVAPALMLVAMMGPMAIGPLRQVVDRGLPRLRFRRVVLLLAGYGAVWMVGLLAAGAVAGMVRASAWFVSATILVAAAVWLCAPARQRCVRRMHAFRPLPVFGFRADAATAAAGARHGVWCVGSCWAPMLVAMLADGAVGFLLMAVAASWLWVEHLDSSRRPGWGLHVPWRAARALLAAARSRGSGCVLAAAPR